MTEAEWLTCTDPDRMLDFLLGRPKESWLRWLGIRATPAGPPPLGWPNVRKKVRQYACACCRRIWPLLHDERSRKAVEVAELYADGQVSEEQLAVATNEARQALVAIQDARLELPLAITLGPPLTSTRAYAHAARAAFEAVSGGNSIDRRFGRFAYFLGRTIWEVFGEDYCENVDQHVMRAAMEAATQLGDEKWAAAAIGAAVRERLLRDLFGNPFASISLSPSWLTWNDGTVVKIAQAIYEDYQFEDLPILADALEDAGCDDEDILRHCRKPGEHVRGCWVVDQLLGKS